MPLFLEYSGDSSSIGAPVQPSAGARALTDAFEAKRHGALRILTLG
jgi:hypothetical protein